ncbi:hypothetical protein BGZ68_004289 [Mortierella alpina]|nr:hypothetical protein BGZ68_004289 [Mortierella alpina]
MQFHSTLTSDTPSPPHIHSESAEWDPVSVRHVDLLEDSDIIAPGAVSPTSGIAQESPQPERHSIRSIDSIDRIDPAHSFGSTTTSEIPTTVASSGISSTSDNAAQELCTPRPVAMPMDVSLADAASCDTHPTLDPTPPSPNHSPDTREEAPASMAATSVQPTALPEVLPEVFPEAPRPLPPTTSSLPLSLGSTPLFAPLSATADQPPPYSPTHTILPHYFSLEPIPLRSYLIKDSASMPSLYDFYLCATTSTSASRPQSPTLQLQERGLAPQLHHSELKYCIIRPQRTDRTALSPTRSDPTPT